MLDLKQVPRIDLGALHTFVVVARLHSFSAAADFLSKTTSAISYRIKTLEDSVGVALFERSTRSVQLTPPGVFLLERAIQIFEWHRGIPEELKQVRDGIEPQFALVINNLLYDPDAAAALLVHLHERYPLTTFQMHRAVNMGVWDVMQRGAGQFGIGAPGFHSINENFRTEAIGVVEWILVASVFHAIAHEREPVTLDMLRPYPVVNIEDTSLQMEKRLPWRLPGQHEMIVPDLATKIAAHAAGLGIGFLPAATAHEAIEQRKLVQIPLAPEIARASSPLSLVWEIKRAGRISGHLRELFSRGDPLVTPFLRPLSPADAAAADADNSNAGGGA
jgi:LysR family transcriptional regulator, transcriptional activator of the allD operon